MEELEANDLAEMEALHRRTDEDDRLLDRRTEVVPGQNGKRVYREGQDVFDAHRECQQAAKEKKKAEAEARRTEKAAKAKSGGKAPRTA